LIRIFDGLTFDDVLLQPQYSEISSRSHVDTSVEICGLFFKSPLISANMASVTDGTMAKAMFDAGAFGIVHRYLSEDLTKKELELVPEEYRCGSVGVQAFDYQRAENMRKYSENICLDIAHADSRRAWDMIKHLKSLDFKMLIAGNVATKDGAARLIEAGANVIKCGIGGGANCSTRVVTGHGVPQLTAIMDAKKSIPKGCYLIADGGCRNSGDVTKALAAGADMVMMGNYFAGADESPSGKTGKHFGMASEEAQLGFLGKVSNQMAEGVSSSVAPKGPVSGLVGQVTAGVRSGLSYSGCRNIKELQENAIFIRMTSNGLKESVPHALL
jgi:IMP dehydrogenase